MEVKIDPSRMDVVMIGRVLGAVAILVTLVTGLYWWIEAGFGIFLNALNSGLGIAFLVLVLTEILNAQLARNRQASGGSSDESE
ncbi:MAG: hypothetical protein OXN15_05490 [Chloroflexota bacterium]|nr:hypothetical protein [Chloroflexota bacterium]